MISIYVLKLQQNKFYIGSSDNVYKRITDHFHGKGSQWTKKYIPIDIIEVIPECDIYDEDKITKKYMFKYGIDNVRGGSYVTINLNNNILKVLYNEYYTINKRCFKCGQQGHYASDCDEINECIKAYEMYGDY